MRTYFITLFILHHLHNIKLSMRVLIYNLTKRRNFLAVQSVRWHSYKLNSYCTIAEYKNMQRLWFKEAGRRLLIYRFCKGSRKNDYVRCAPLHVYRFLHLSISRSIRRLAWLPKVQICILCGAWFGCEKGLLRSTSLFWALKPKSLFRDFFNKDVFYWSRRSPLLNAIGA